jgi:hypothetical protein
MIQRIRTFTKCNIPRISPTLKRQKYKMSVFFIIGSSSPIQNTSVGLSNLAHTTTMMLLNHIFRKCRSSLVFKITLNQFDRFFRFAILCFKVSSTFPQVTRCKYRIFQVRKKFNSAYQVPK